MEFEKPKFGTKKWFENYWYHYKWPTIAGAFVAFIVISFTHEMLTKEKFDSEVFLSGQVYVTYEQGQRIADILEGYGVDFDGNGEVNVAVYPSIFSDEDYAMMMSAQAKLMVEATEGVSMMMILDEHVYGMLASPDMFMDLSAYSDKAYDGGRKIKLSDTVIGQDPELAFMADQYFLVFRTADSYAVTKNEKTQKNYDNQKILLENLLSDTKTS